VTKEELYAHPGWEWCTFEGARRHTLLMGMNCSFREKLEWLEEAENLVIQMRTAREARQGKQLRVAEQPEADRTKEQITPNE